MFKKVKPAVLMIVLIILLVVYLVVRYSGSGDRNFKDKVLDFDPAAVTEVIITIPDQTAQTHLKLDGDEWQVLVNGQPYRADTNNVKTLLAQLSQLVTKRYAGKSKEVWKKYAVTDSAAVKVDLFSGSKEIAKLLIGKFDYTQPENQQPGAMRQQQGEMSTYVRLDGDKSVYVVDGFLKMSVGKVGDAFRDKNLTMIKRNDVTSLTLDYPDQKMMLEDQGGKWTINGAPADSMKVIHYLSTISRLSSQEFIYDDLNLGSPSQTLTIEGNNFTPIQISAYPVADTNIQYVLVSSRNPGAYFNGKKSKLYGKIMVDQTAFLPDPPK